MDKDVIAKVLTIRDPQQRACAILSLISDALKGMSDEKIAQIRASIANDGMSGSPDFQDVLDLIEGHMALRQIERSE